VYTYYPLINGEQLLWLFAS